MATGHIFLSWDRLLLYIAVSSLVLGWLPLRLPAGPRRVLRRIGVAALLTFPLLHVSIWGAPGSPQRTTRRFLRDARTELAPFARERNCRAPLARLSAAARADLEADRTLLGMSPDARACAMLSQYAAFAPDSVHLVSAGDTTAIVQVSRPIGGGFLLPGFWPTKVTWKERKLTLVREDGGWKIGPPPRGVD